MKKYNRIMLGKAGLYADQCKQEGFIGADFGIEEDMQIPMAAEDETYIQKR